MFLFSPLVKPFFSIDYNIVKDILLEIDNYLEKPQNGLLNIIFVDLEKIKELNCNYRGKNYSTDVLSFHYYDDFSDLGDTDVAGELIFCEEKIKTQAIEYGLGEEAEFYKLFIHSILHIIGYDHENYDEYLEMERLEKIIWVKIFEKND